MDPSKKLRSDAGYTVGEAQRKKRQDELAQKATAGTLDRLLAAKDKLESGGMGRAAKTTKDMVSYRSLAEVPPAPTLTVQVDHKSESLLLPIYGVMVPFHISTVKSIAATDAPGDKEQSFIRITFNVPGSHTGPVYDPAVKFPGHTFIKELSFKTGNAAHAQRVVADAKNLQRQIAAKDREKAAKATLVQQDRLIPAKGKVPTLRDVWCRPTLGGRGRKLPGVLECHTNGFRYTTPRTDEVVDVMFGNIKHAVFQPAVKEVMTVVHFHLHNPIMVNKKKTQDVQFYVEVMEVVQTLDGGRRYGYDPDEIEEEQRERERRNK